LEGADSARVALRLGLSVQLRLFAPVLPFVTEEVWSWWRDGSIHLVGWPEPGELAAGAGDPAVYDTASALVGAVRKAKSDARLSMRTVIERATVAAPAAEHLRIQEILPDVLAAGQITEVTLMDGGPDEGVTVKLRL
ncbi:MAG: class I tRNA ligase family protein, partial [Jiangellaceae bacterium]